MKFKPGRALICLLLILALSTGVLAVDPANYTDISGHWATPQISYCLTHNLFNGVSETTFAPEVGMSRGMFITVLGRMVGIDPDSYRNWYLPYLYTDVSSTAYYAPYVNWATRYGIVYGVGDRRFDPDSLITREQMATMLIRFTSTYNYALTAVDSNITSSFTDAGSISGWAADAVESLRVTGIMNGYPDGRFAPRDTSTRAMCAAVICRLDQAMTPYTGRTVVEPTGVTVSSGSLSLTVGKTASLSGTISPAGATNQKLTWFSSSPGIATVDENGKVTAVAPGTANVYVMTCNGRSSSCAVTVNPDSSLAYAGESYSDKCNRIFDHYVSDYDSYYASKGDSHVTTISVRVWQFTDSSHTTKTTKTISLRVHKNLAATFKAIFEEIYNGPEKFPIYAAGCYRSGERSEHGCGVAVDINWEENYECRNDGTALTGKYWKPGVDPYSIPIGGDVEKAFRKYGFGWGGTDWRSKHDYMHFSYFGT